MVSGGTRVLLNLSLPDQSDRDVLKRKSTY